MRSADMAAMLVAELAGASAKGGIGWHSGVVRSWDELTGLNTIAVNGTDVDNVLVLSTGVVQPFRPGDVVGLLAVGSQYFILGKVRAPGQSAALQIRSATVNASATTTSTKYGDLDAAGGGVSRGPELGSVYIGSSRRALVFVKASMSVKGTSTSGETALANVRVVGASNIAPMVNTPAFIGSGGPNAVSASAMSTILLTDAHGLRAGLNTFTMEYAVLNGVETGYFQDRTLTVWPF